MFITFTDTKNVSISIDSGNFYLEKFEDKNGKKIFVVNVYISHERKIFFVDEECYNNIIRNIKYHETMLEG